jgi:hypothetical protein
MKGAKRADWNYHTIQQHGQALIDMIPHQVIAGT